METRTVTTTKKAEQKTKQTEENAAAKEGDEEYVPESSSQKDALFSCRNPGCVCMFQFHYKLEFHLLYGKCKLESEILILLDKAKILYAENLQERSGT